MEIKNVKLKLATVAVILSSTVSAQDYQTFGELTYAQSDIAGVSTDALSISAQYFFDNKTALGPYSEFEYINKVSNVFASYINVESGDFYSTNMGGEAFVNNVLFGASLDYSKGHDTANSVSFGYLFNDNLLVRVDRNAGDNMDAYYMVSAAYNHQLNDTDYIGVTFETDDEAETLSLSSRYFTHLGDDRYFAFNVAYQDFDVDNAWEVGANYYFNKATGISASFDSEDSMAIGLEHFFNPNIAVKVGYAQSEVGTEDADSFFLTVKGQF
jgi:hypothetical protein